MSKTTAEGPMKLSEKIKDKRYHDRKSVIISDNDLADWAKDASQLEQAQTWIPVSSGKMPEPKQYVLALVNGEDNVPHCVYYDPEDPEAEDYGPFVSELNEADRWARFYLRNVTHWMPLPEAPFTPE